MPVEGQEFIVTTHEYQNPLASLCQVIVVGLLSSVCEDLMLHCHSWLCGCQASFWHNLEPPETEEERETEEEEEEEEKENYESLNFLEQFNEIR